MAINIRLKHFTPSARHHWLILLAGLLWSMTGIALCLAALYWLSAVDWPRNLISAVCGCLLGTAAYHFAFKKIARKNIDRIASLPSRVCLFAFQAWRSYLLIASMMALGFLLRHSSLPRTVLGVVYLTIGAALTLSSSVYYERLF